MRLFETWATSLVSSRKPIINNKFNATTGEFMKSRNLLAARKLSLLAVVLLSMLVPTILTVTALTQSGSEQAVPAVLPLATERLEPKSPSEDHNQPSLDQPSFANQQGFAPQALTA